MPRTFYAHDSLIRVLLHHNKVQEKEDRMVWDGWFCGVGEGRGGRGGWHCQPVKNGTGSLIS